MGYIIKSSFIFYLPESLVQINSFLGKWPFILNKHIHHQSLLCHRWKSLNLWQLFKNGSLCSHHSFLFHAAILTWLQLSLETKFRFSSKPEKTFQVLRSSNLSNRKSNSGSTCFILMGTKTSKSLSIKSCSFIWVTSHSFGYLPNNQHEFLFYDPSKCCLQNLRRNTSQFIPLGYRKDMQIALVFLCLSC